MYYLKTIIINVYHFELIQNELVYSINGEVHTENKVYQAFYDDHCVIINFHEKPFLRYSDGQGVLLDKEPIHIKNALNTYKTFVVTAVSKIKNKRLIYDYNLYDIDKKEELFPQPINEKIVVHNGLFLTHPFPKISISRVSETGTPLWQFAFSQLAPVYWDTNTLDTLEKIVGAAHGNIWVTTDGGRLVAINANTGELTKAFTAREEDKKYGYEYTIGFGWIDIRPDDNNIYGMSSIHFSKINTKTLIIEISYLFSELKSKELANFDIYRTLLQGKYCTFLGRKKNESKNCWIGVFDYTLRKTVWLHRVLSDEELKKGNELNINHPPKMAGNKLYIKDVKHNLHVFEKEAVVS